jgi:hypothetical protein
MLAHLHFIPGYKYATAYGVGSRASSTLRCFLTQSLDYPSRIPLLSECLRRNPSPLRFFHRNYALPLFNCMTIVFLFPSNDFVFPLTLVFSPSPLRFFSHSIFIPDDCLQPPNPKFDRHQVVNRGNKQE